MLGRQLETADTTRLTQRERDDIDAALASRTKLDATWEDSAA